MALSQRVAVTEAGTNGSALMLKAVPVNGAKEVQIAC